MGRTKNRKGNVPVKSKLKKDPGIPKLPDLKVKVKSQQKKPDVPLERRFDSDAHMASEPTLSTLAQLAAEASSNVQEEPSSSTSTREKTKEQLRRYYVKSLHKVIDESDIILLVLDARDPEGCRSRLVEEEVRRRESEGKITGIRVSLLKEFGGHVVTGSGEDGSESSTCLEFGPAKVAEQASNGLRCIQREILAGAP
ncbi:hypothetical protein CC1G_04107 [Coprinopsis cinerea okayama7|uniref:Uncharacterized protein n=1 Tax=Coprinopsis cinerea (strain Okayama-7 / 130 / ATCC MYA-4618 / FGSC 9003) TaxID=240176 RepID=A8NW04_COPC7|nr:hypothetical protein CC1G_04107 [Coprinopsis cinerea okayama7\|eukprot:XP_001836794.1 hypothetical protein CC1G_04107 [Coprinopsis cinerea okayama7\